jgi:predicted nucleotidyltransferase component of viral defense system
MFDPVYVRQAKLLLRCLPEIGKQPCFALKGGTAINLFLRSMPRLSVDIDLTYLPLSARDEALADMSRALETIAADVTRRIAGARVQVGRSRGMATKLAVSCDGVQIKVEPNQVLRGSVYPPETRDLCAEAQAFFELFVSTRTLSLADIYGGKLCAALDRQHPRDLYDVRLLLANEGLTPQVRRAFVVYLASHDRPMHELLNPQFKDIAKVYAGEFAGMPREEVPLQALCETRERLVVLIREGLDVDEKRFLVSMKQGEPEWDVLDIAHLRELPALQWKLQNIRRMEPGKRKSASGKLQEALGL